ncbi:AarF/UbiB family protein [Conexibacter sp. DBS9H8]|uniref:AarF/UbiB family protein n=1 Tax=Conexibacter sp. DBS9H8 TaxID=2937801 RepID=UPI00200C8345|nr:AarF/ABC1/UbiB kinase family protein [Conexibacter sp. DBS9H8]
MPSSAAADAAAQIEALIGVALGLARTTTAGRLVLTRLGANLHPSWIREPLAGPVGSAIEAATVAAAAPLRIREVEAILRDAWGVRRVEATLDSLEIDPVAVTAIAQVHRGVHDGRSVAIKVLRPGLASAVRQDLALLDGLLTPLAGAFPALDPAGLVREVRERVMDELDLEHEATMMRRFHRALRSGPVRAPAPVSELCHETVLVSEWLEGQPLFDGVGSRADTVAAALLTFVVGGLREGLVHCDLDRADLRLLADGSVGVLDYGAVATVDRSRADHALAVLDAFLRGDADALDDAVVALGVLAPGSGESALTVTRAVLGPLGEPAPSRLDIAAVNGVLSRLEDQEEAVLGLALAARLPPGDLYPARAIGQLCAQLAYLGATGSWLELARDALTRGWAA